jgi:hypothetical protein
VSLERRGVGSSVGSDAAKRDGKEEVGRTDDCLTHKAIRMTTATTTSPNFRGKDRGAATEDSSSVLRVLGTCTKTSRPQEHREATRMDGTDKAGESAAVCRACGDGHAEGAALGKPASSRSAGSGRRPEAEGGEPWKGEMRRHCESSPKLTHGRRIRALGLDGGHGTTLRSNRSPLHSLRTRQPVSVVGRTKIKPTHERMRGRCA